MTWTKLSDDFGDQVAGLSDAAFRTHVEALVWTMRRCTGGMLTDRDVRRFAESPDADAGVKELVALGYWTEEDTGYRIRHHMEHQPEPDLVERRRGQAAERQRRKRRRDAGLVESHPSRRDSLSDDTRYPGRDGSGRDGLATTTTGELGNDAMRQRSEAELRAEVEEHARSAEAWYRDTSLEYAVTPGGSRFHFVTCPMVGAALNAAGRGEAPYPVRLSMDDVNARNLRPCGVCIGGNDPWMRGKA
ncbi:hypothetical protein EV652_110342 [Kribbella steppae]|uniref:Uncharacterized protein n=1 Tax=Kribbella steppae TaxID=2512223 RepID=A0A4R2H7F3_9ACTN|nr:hypothetical protein [Kribbella steppae]TCO22356.1 hypothetical protein EV652_110342 [Kribbella steppae]